MRQKRPTSTPKSDRDVPQTANRTDLLPDEPVAQGTDAELAAGIREAKEQLAPVPTDDTPAMEGEAQDAAQPEAPAEPVWGQINLKDEACFVVPYKELNLTPDMAKGCEQLPQQFPDVKFLFNWYTKKVWLSGTHEVCQQMIKAFPNANFESV